MSRNTLLIINGAALTGCAVFDYAVFDYLGRTNLLISLMLFLPLLDKAWLIPELSINKSKLISWGIITTAALLLLAVNPEYAITSVSTLAFAALPEEWFFRGYFMTQLEKTVIWLKQKNNYVLGKSAHISNILSSAFFALLHTSTQGWFGLSVFFPSLIYGWLYQRTGDIVLVILLHALSNIVFLIYIQKMLL